MKGIGGGGASLLSILNLTHEPINEEQAAFTPSAD
jgi:hypothetical protein